MTTQTKILDRGSFCGYGYTVREGESHFDGVQRAVKRCYGKAAYLHRNRSSCSAGPWECVVHIPCKDGGINVEYPGHRSTRWKHADFFEVLTVRSAEGSQA